MESNKIIPKGILFPFILLTTLFFACAICWDMDVVLFPVPCLSRNTLINQA